MLTGAEDSPDMQASGRTGVQLPTRAVDVVLEELPDRSAIYLPPASGRPRALAVELHGSGLDPQRQYRMATLAELLNAEGIAVVLPRGAIQFRLRPDMASGFAWNVPGTPLPGQTDAGSAKFNDVEYISLLVEHCQKNLGLVEMPVFLVGYSGGARLASHLLLAGNIQWRAAGLVAGLRLIGDGRRPPPPTISFHGFDDPINPFAGGIVPRWESGVEEAARGYAAFQGATEEQLSRIPGADRRVYRMSNGDPMLETYLVADAAHAWPGTRDDDHLKFFGPAGKDIHASALITSFFTARIGVRQIKETLDNLQEHSRE